MTKKEISNLFTRISNHYSMFTRSEEKIEEWYRFLKDYSSEDVNRRLDEYLKCEYDQPPLCLSLTKGIEKIKKSDEDDSWTTRCDICKQKITIYNNDMEEYEKHFRRCSMIDFIDRMSVEFRQQHIASVKYYQMSDEELQKNYDKIMKFYRENKDNKEILKKMEDVYE